MQIIITNEAHNSINSLVEYTAKHFSKNRIETIDRIYEHIKALEKMPYIGRYAPGIPDKNFREIIYKKHRQSYRIVYFISENTSTIYILFVASSKQDFNRFFKTQKNLFNKNFNFNID